jgi:photosystem II stability/assembly factor-like uncharacterized protein
MKAGHLIILLFFFIGYSNLNAKWIEIGPNNDQNIENISIASNDSYVLLGTKYGIYISDNSGKSWKYKLFNTRIYTLAIDGTIFFAGTDDGLYISGNYGQSWEIVLSKKSVASILIKGQTIVVGTNEGIFLSNDYGSNWQNTLVGHVEILSFTTDGNNIYAGGDSYIYISTNNGINWTSFPINDRIVSSLNWYNDFIFAGVQRSGTDGFGGIYLSSNSGKKWKKLEVLPKTNCNSLIIINSYIIAATNEQDFGHNWNGVFYSNDNGQNWKKFNGGFKDANYTYIKCLSYSNKYIYAVEHYGSVYRCELEELIKY